MLNTFIELKLNATCRVRGDTIILVSRLFSVSQLKALLVPKRRYPAPQSAGFYLEHLEGVTVYSKTRYRIVANYVYLNTPWLTPAESRITPHSLGLKVLIFFVCSLVVANASDFWKDMRIVGDT